jgi:prepilin-type processing-associated H-X9-DG protein
VLLVACLGAIGAGGKRRVKESICAANLKGWGQALFAFAEDNDGYLLYRSYNAVGWYLSLRPYYIDTKLVFCFEATATYAEGGVNPHMAWETDIWGDPNLSRGSYVINLWITQEPNDRHWEKACVSSASSVPMVLDAQWRDMEPYASDAPLPYETSLWTPHADEMQRACVNRHNGVNVVFMDGSVRKIGLKDLWVQRWYRGWEEDLGAMGFPAWPEWMANFKEPQL